MSDTKSICESKVVNNISLMNSRINSTPSKDCGAWSADIDTRLAALDATLEPLKQMFADVKTKAEMDNYNVEADKYKAAEYALGSEIERFDAQCAT
jgi:hypothetical protein